MTGQHFTMFFGGFSLAFAILSFFSLVGGIAIKKLVTEQVTERVIKDVGAESQKHMRAIAEDETGLRWGELIAFLLTPFWQVYQEDYQKFRRGEANNMGPIYEFDLTEKVGYCLQIEGDKPCSRISTASLT